MNFSDKTVWITGASSGIGKALALAFADHGSTLILSARNKEKLAEVKTLCVAKTAPCVVIPMDVTDHEAIPGITDDVLMQVGKVDILINNAGISQRSKVEETNLSVDKKIFDVNVFGAFATTRAILPHMITRKSGNIVIISSVAGKIATPYRSAYAASKHAVIAWYEALRAEVHDRNIKVHIVCPGYIKTDISINAIGKNGEAHGVMDKSQDEGISAEQCASDILKAIAANKSEVVIAGKEKWYILIKKFFPGFIEKRMRTFKPS